MAGVDFSISSSAEIDKFIINPVGAQDGQSLVYDGTAFTPKDIVPVGTIEMWAGGTTPPFGWLLCDGTPYDWSQYTRLRDVIGITYGGTDQSNWFVPNLCTTNPAIKAPVGIGAGVSRGDANSFFSNTSVSHSHTHATAQVDSSNADNPQNHFHNVGQAIDHSHTLASAGWSHQHNADAPSGGHSHNYQRGNAAAGTTGNTNHGAHNTSSNTHTHTHTIPSNTGGGLHSHTLAQHPMGHTHNWTTTGQVSSSAGSNHQHTVNAQPIYFIIKF